MSLKPIAAYSSGYFPVATDGSSLTNLMANTLVGPAASRSCNLLFVDYGTTVPMGQRDGTIAYPYLTGAEAVAYIGTQPTGSDWRVIMGPGTEPSTLTVPSQYQIFFEGHRADLTNLLDVHLTADLPSTSTIGYKNMTVGNTVIADGGSPGGAIIYTENSTRGSITQSGTSLVSVIDAGSVNEGNPAVFPSCTVAGDTIVTGSISGNNVIYDTDCTALTAQSVYLSGCSLAAATITVVETTVIKDSVWDFYNPQIISAAGDFPIDIYIDAPSTISWNDKRGTAPNDTFVTINYGTANEEYSCNTDDRYYFGRQSVVQFRSDWNSTIATWDYLGSLPARGDSFTTGSPAQARASIKQRKDWLLVQPSYDGTGLFLGSRQLLHAPGSNISVELGPLSMDGYSQSPFVDADIMYWVFSEQLSGDIDLNNLVLFQLARTAIDTWTVGMIVKTFGMVVYNNSNTIISDTCPLSYIQISKTGSIVEAFYSKDKLSWKSVGSYDAVSPPLALDRVSIFVQAGQGPNTIFGFKEYNVYQSPTI